METTMMKRAAAIIGSLGGVLRPRAKKNKHLGAAQVYGERQDVLPEEYIIPDRVQKGAFGRARLPKASVYELHLPRLEGHWRARRRQELRQGGGRNIPGRTDARYRVHPCPRAWASKYLPHVGLKQQAKMAARATFC